MTHRELGGIELTSPEGARAIMRRPRATKEQRLAADAPGFLRERAAGIERFALYMREIVELAREHLDGGERSFAEMRDELGELAPPQPSVAFEVPVSEIEAVINYLVAHTVRVEGVPDFDWGAQTPEQRFDFFDEMGTRQITAVFNGYHRLRMERDEPELVAKAKAMTEAPG